MSDGASTTTYEFLGEATPRTEGRSTQLSGAGYTLLVTAIWAALSVRRPELTYHFGPVLAAAAWPATLVGASRRALALAAVGAFAVVAVVGVILHQTDKLLGPTFWHTRPAITEVLWFAAAGAILGAVAATVRS